MLKDSQEIQTTVLMLPDYRKDNPYQSLLVHALIDEGVSVTFPDGYRRILPLVRAWLPRRAEILHLHWIEPYLRSQNSLVRMFYGLKLVCELMMLRLLGAHVIWTIHNVLPHDTTTPKLDGWLMRRLVGTVDGTIFHSSSSLTAFERHHNVRLANTQIAHHGTYERWYPSGPDQAEARELLDLPKDVRVYLAFGMIRPYKGILELIRAWSRTEMKQAVLVIAGEVGDQDLGNALKTLSGGSVVFLPGRKTDEEVSQLFRAADIAVFNYRQILTSGGVLLAVSFGLPTIAPGFPAIRELLSESSLLFEPNDEAALHGLLAEAAIANLEAEKQYVARVRADNSWARAAALTHSCYRSSLAAGK